MASEDSASVGESCSSEDEDEREGALASADCRRGVAVFAGFDAGRGGLKAVGLRFGAVFEGLEGMVSSVWSDEESFVFRYLPRFMNSCKIVSAKAIRMEILR